MKRLTGFALIGMAVFLANVSGCRQEESAPNPEVKDITFSAPSVSVRIGESIAVKVNITPAEARRYAEVAFIPSREGYLAVGEQSNDGCVITALKGGTVVLVAKAGSSTAYLEVKIQGDAFVQVPYIQVPQQVMEIIEGNRKTAQVSLFNGSPTDQQLFEWYVETGKDNISIMPTGNTVVIQGEKRGSQKILVKHAKSEYDGEILVFVVAAGETTRYITTGQNVITMAAGGATKELTAQLVGGTATDIAGFDFSVVEEFPCIQILPSNNSCNIIALRQGTALINIHHPLAEYDMRVRVIVTQGEESYIEASPTFSIIDIGSSVIINGTMEGFHMESWNKDWKYERKGDVDSVNVTQTNGQFFVQGLRAGKCALEISNKSMNSYPREALVVVRDPTVVPPDEYYITTSQNVIQMEVGQNFPTELAIQLINGEERHKAQFVWTVEDGRVIEVDPLDTDSVKYITRNMVKRNISEIKRAANTIALVTPKKIGTTKITIEHPLSPAAAVVIVKVYPKGTFGNSLYVLNRKEGGLIKVDTEKQPVVPVSLYIAKPENGDVFGLGKVEWKILPGSAEFPEIAAKVVDTMQSVENEITGLGKGINKLSVNNEGVMKFPFEATVMVGTTKELEAMCVLYVDQARQTVAVGQNVYVQILNSNMNPVFNSKGEITGYTPNDVSESPHYKVTFIDGISCLNAVMLKNRLMLQGTNAGIAHISISNEAYPDAVPVELSISVIPGFTTIDKPFMLTSNENIIGMVWGTERFYQVSLQAESNAASRIEEDKIFWTSSNGTLVKLPNHPYGKNILLTAGNGNQSVSDQDKVGQSNVTASHPLSINEKVTVVYVVAKESDLGKLVLGIEKDHWLLNPGEEIMISLITNADGSPGRNVNDIVWLNKNGFDFQQGAADSLIEVDYTGTRAMVKAKEGANGSTCITVTHKEDVGMEIPQKTVVPLKIYISVSKQEPLAKSITLPAIVEMIVNENKVVSAVTNGMDQNEINKIEWFVEDDSIAAPSTDLPIDENNPNRLAGGKLYLKGKKKGQTWITAGQSEIGYRKKILLVCASTYEELANTYVMATDESYFRMKKGDVKAISLVYGSAGFPQSKKAEITWEDISQNSVVKIHPPQYDYAEIEAVNDGLAVVKVNHKDVFRPVELTFEVSRDLMPGQNYKFEYTGMMGLVIWNGQTNQTPGPNYGQSLEMESPYTKKAALGIIPSGLSYSGITWSDEEKPDKETVKVSPGGLGNEYLITAKKKGQTYLRFTHSSKLIADDARILVYTANTEQELQQMFPIGISQTNYLLNKRKNAADSSEDIIIRINVPSQAMTGLANDNAAYKAKLDKIGCSTANGSGAVFSLKIDLSENLSKYKQEYTVSPIGVGSSYFDIQYGTTGDMKLIERIYISVREKGVIDGTKRIITESIIGMTKGTKGRVTQLGTNLTAAERENLNWYVKGPKIITLHPQGDLTNCTINAEEDGNTEIVVSYESTEGKIERFIKVYVRPNPDDFKEINLDTRYYCLRRNDVLTLTAFHAAKDAAGDDQWKLGYYAEEQGIQNSFLPYDNNVVELKTKGPDGKPYKDKVEILGVNEGIASVVLFNEECYSPVTFMVEVNNTAPKTEIVVDDWYLTAIKTVYAIDPEKTQDITMVSVTPMRFPPEEAQKITWKLYSETFGEGDKRETHIPENEPGYKPSLLVLNGTKGTSIGVQPRLKKGTAVLRASHGRSVNDMDITVICDRETALSNPSPHIEVNKETVKLQLNEEAEVDIRLEGVTGGYDIAEFSAISDNPQKVSVRAVGSRLFIKGENFGQALVSVTHPKADGFIKKIIVIVMSGDTSLVYLTTKQNFVVLEKQQYTAIEADLVGYSDMQSKNYIWTTDDNDIIDIKSTGKQAIITAKNVTKTAKITVQHIACLEYPLSIYVRVTEKNTGNPTYITTANNIVSIKEGAGIQVKATLVNGQGQELSNFVWSTQDRQLVELNYSGDTALVKGILSGTALVNIWHPSSLNSINILVVVEPLEPDNGIYITTDTQLIEMSTQESQRQIKARLIGGTPEDIYGFQWQVTSFNSVIKQGSSGQSFQPITILTNADTCYIQPVTAKYEGEAIITISHPKTSYKMDVKVIIADTTEIKFAQSYVNVNQYSQATVGLNAPKNGVINVTVQQAGEYIRAYATNTMCVIEGLNEGTAIVRASNVSGTKSDELVIHVNKVDLTNYAYIHVLYSLMWNKELSEEQHVKVQLRGIVKAEDEMALMNLMTCSISNSAVLALQHNYGKEKQKENGDAQDRYTWELSFKAIGTGLSEVEFKIPTTTESQKIFNTYPALKDKVVKVYFRVTEGQNVFAVDKSDIQVYAGSVGDAITASIDLLRSEGVKAENITWNIYDDKGKESKIISLAKEPGSPNNTTGTYTMRISAETEGYCYIEVKFASKGSKYVNVTVLPVEYLNASRTNIQISPEEEQDVLITCNPPDRDLIITFDSNNSVYETVYVRVNDGTAVPSEQTSAKFQMLSGSFKAGKTGTVVRVRGTQTQGTSRMTVKDVKTGRQVQVAYTNLKNYYARWINMPVVRFDPSTKQTQTELTKVYYECSPPNDSLIILTDEQNYGTWFSIEAGEDRVGETVKKYIWIKYAKSGDYKDKYGIVVKDGPEAIRFETKATKQEINLPVFIYYEKIDVQWKNANSNNGKKSKFDEVTYAISLAYGTNQSIQVNMEVSDNDPVKKGAVILRQTYNGKDWIRTPNSNIKITGFDPVGKSFTISREAATDAERANPTIPSSWQPAGAEYQGVLEVDYEYFNGSIKPETFTRKFLIYALKF